MEVLVQWVLMLLAILGLVQLGEMICLWSRRPKKRPASFSVLPVFWIILSRWLPGARKAALPLSSTAGWMRRAQRCAAERVRSTDGCIFAPSRSLRVFAKRHRMEYTRKHTKVL